MHTSIPTPTLIPRHVVLARVRQGVTKHVYELVIDMVNRMSTYLAAIKSPISAGTLYFKGICSIEGGREGEKCKRIQ